ncbi:DMT family transporter [Candidatus Woesearchaeota archaeon]|nr:MAG: DMT family transporter [Candidatus Woesearchaeota archaeon]
MVLSWLFFAFASAALISIFTIVEKKSLLKEHAMKFATVLALFNALLSFFYISKVDFSISPKFIFIIFLLAIINAVAFLLMAKAIRHMEISVSTPILNFGPAITAMFAFLFLGESIGLSQIGGILLLIAGVYIVEVDHDWTNLKNPLVKMLHSKYIHFLFFSMALYAIGTVADKYVLNQGVDKFTLLFFAHIFIAIIYIIFISAYYNGASDIVSGIRESGKYIFVIAVLMSLSRIFYLEAISLAMVSLVIPIRRLSTLFVTFFGGNFFHENGLKIKIIGCCITLLGVALIVL